MAGYRSDFSVDIRGSVKRLDLQPGDTILIELEHIASTSVHERIREYVQSVFPDNKVLTLDHGMKLSIVSPRGGGGSKL